LSDLNEIRAEAYKSARSYKEWAKLFHDQHIFRKEFGPRMKVLLYDSKLHLFPGKLRSDGRVLILSHMFFPIMQLKFRILIVVPPSKLIASI